MNADPQVPAREAPPTNINWFSQAPKSQAPKLEPPSAELPAEPVQTTERDTSSSQIVGEEANSLANWTKKALYERAKQLKIAGRSKMTKEELIRALGSFPPGEKPVEEETSRMIQSENPLSTEKYKAQLRQLRAEAVRELERSADAISQDITAPGDLARTPSHPADRDSEGVERELSIARVEKSQVEQIDAALERLHAGTFGKCEGCGKTIAEERLTAVPYAAYCAECAESVGSEV